VGWGSENRAEETPVRRMNIGSLVYIVTEPGDDHKPLWDSPEYWIRKNIGSISCGQMGIVIHKAIENSAGISWVKIAFTSGLRGWIQQVWVEEVAGL
jgi:hypothetical protein